MNDSNSLGDGLGKGSWRVWLPTLTCLLAYALWMRAPHLVESLWLDELHSSWVIAGDWDQIASRCRISNQALLYFLALKAWTFWGDQEVALRLPSLLAGLTLIGLMLWECWRGARSFWAALAVGLLAATDRRFVFYATEARTYALVQVLAFAHVLISLRVLRTNSLAARAAWVILGGLLFHLHYTAALFVGAEWLWLTMMSMKSFFPGSTRLQAERGSTAERPWGLLQARVLEAFAVAVLICPSLWHLGEIADRRFLWSSIAAANHPLEMLTVFESHQHLGTALVLLGLIGVGSWFLRGAKTPSVAWQGERLRRLERVALWFIAALAPVALAWFATNLNLAPLFMSRYLIASSAAAMILTGYAIAAAPARLQPLVVLATLAVVIANSPNLERYYRWGRAIEDRQENWRDAVAWASQQDRDSPYPILVRAGLLEESTLANSGDEDVRRYLAFPVRGAYRVAPMDPQDCFALALTRQGASVQDAALDRILSRGGCMLLIRGRQRDAEAISRQLVRRLRSPDRQIQTKAGPAFGFVHARIIVIEELP